MSKSPLVRAGTVAALLLLTACTSTKPAAGPSASAQPPASAPAQSKFFNQADFDKQMAQRTKTPQGDPATQWEQTIAAHLVATSKYKKAGPWHACLSNAGVGNPWRPSRSRPSSAGAHAGTQDAP